LFASKAVDGFKSFMLRNSDAISRTHFQDAMMQTLLIGQMDIDYLGYSPASLYINGRYWGIQNIREKSSEDYLFTNYHLDEDSIDMLENENSVIAGDNTDYNALLNFLKNNNLSVQQNYDYVKEKIDIESYLDYQIAEIYIVNLTGGRNMNSNQKQGSTAMDYFRYGLWFGLYTSPDHNTLALQRKSIPDYLIALISITVRKLHGEFRNRFWISSVYIHYFRPERVIGIIDS
jgi:hypothetical protein